MSSLFSLTQAALELEMLILRNQGELTPELEKELELTQENVKHKVDNYFHIIESLDAKVKALNDIGAKYYDASLVLRGTIKRLKDNLRTHMNTLGLARVEGNLVSYKFSEKQSAVIIEDEKVIPQDYLLTKTVHSPDKERIRAALELGIPVPGCRLEPTMRVEINKEAGHGKSNGKPRIEGRN